MELGFTENESHAWMALLRENPATAYETARASGIPTAKIYPVLDRLVGRGIVLELDEDGKKRYVPCDPEDFLATQRRRNEELIDDLSRELKSLGPRAEVSYIWNLSTYGSLLERAEAMIKSANSSILISTWKEELAPLVSAIRLREREGVRVAVVHFGHAEERGGALYEHPIADTLYAERGGRGFALIVDGETALMGTVTSEFEAQGAWSGNQGFVLLAEDYVKHDIYIMKIVNRFDRELTERFGEGYPLLRDIFSDKEAR